MWKEKVVFQVVPKRSSSFYALYRCFSSIHRMLLKWNGALLYIQVYKPEVSWKWDDTYRAFNMLTMIKRFLPQSPSLFSRKQIIVKTSIWPNRFFYTHLSIIHWTNIFARWYNILRCELIWIAQDKNFEFSSSIVFLLLPCTFLKYDCLSLTIFVF